MKRCILAVTFILYVFLLTGCGMLSALEQVQQEPSGPVSTSTASEASSSSRPSSAPVVSSSSQADETPDPNEYDTLLDLAGDDDLVLVVYDPSPELVAQSGTTLIDLDNGQGSEILLVNASDADIYIDYRKYSQSVYVGSETQWDGALAPKEAVLLNSLYSEGTPSHVVYIIEPKAGVEVSETPLSAEYQITFDGSGERGPVFIKRGDASTIWNVMFAPENPLYFVLDEYRPDAEFRYDEYFYFMPDGTGIWGFDTGETVFISWDRQYIYSDGKEWPYDSVENLLWLYAPVAEGGRESDGRKYVLYDPGDIPESVMNNYGRFLEIGTDPGNMSDSALVDYLLAAVPKAKEMIANGMTAFVSGETTALPEDVCRDVWLGTDLDGKFTREILYTVSSQGTVYEYDVVTDSWSIVS